MANTSYFGLSALSPTSSGSRRSLDSPILGHPDDKYAKRTRRWTLDGRLGSRRAFRTLLVLIATVVLLFFWKYQVHVEIQVFSRGWISKSILPTPPLSSTCFSESSILASSYNTTLVNSPSYVELHAGIGMPLGDDCFNFASTIPKAPLPGMELPRHTIYHTYWRADLLPLGERQVSLLHSLLAMQDRESSSVILWTNSETTPPLQNSPLLVPLLYLYGSRFSIQRVDKKALAKGTAMEGHKLLELADKKAWLDGDLVRILVLWSFGGTWVDMDTIMTGRDMRVLGESEWVTQWDCYDKIYQPLNGAMMHFYQHSPYLCEMLYSMSNDPTPRQGTTDWGSLLYHKIFRRLIANSIAPFKILPYCFTDAYSCRLDNRLPDPFGGEDKSWGAGKAEALEKKVKNVWAVHLHNQWEKSFKKDGWVNKFILEKVDEAVGKYEVDGSRSKEIVS